MLRADPSLLLHVGFDVAYTLDCRNLNENGRVLLSPFLFLGNFQPLPRRKPPPPCILIRRRLHLLPHQRRLALHFHLGSKRIDAYLDRSDGRIVPYYKISSPN